ncbi:MAG: rhomboid family intramembrane serine protease [Hyphomicrobiales bacterium]
MSEQSTSSQKAINAPSVVLAMIGVFVAIHLYRGYLNGIEDLRVILTFGFIPARYLSYEGGAAALLPGGAAAEVWTFVTYSFLHADWLHLAVNSFWMLAFGSVVARRMGASQFVLFSLLCAAAGAALHLYLYWGEMVPMIGASAAISGQMAGAVRFIFARPANLFQASRMDPAHLRAESLVQVMRNPRALIFLAVWMALNVFFGISSKAIPGVDDRIAWEAHLGGFLAGLILFGVFDRARKMTLKPL